MKTRSCVTALMLATCLPMARAGDIGAFGSLWDQQDGDKVYGGGAVYLFEVLPLELRGTYYESASIPEAGDVAALPVDLGFTADLTRTSVVDLYVGAGGSYYFLDADEGDVDNEFGWYAGARLEIPLEKESVAIFGEALYRGIGVEHIDADLSGFAFNVGLIFR